MSTRAGFRRLERHLAEQMAEIEAMRGDKG